MRQFVVLLAVVGLVVLLAPATFTLAQAEMYSITVMADDTTDGDLALIETFLATATDGDPISQSLRRILMAAVGEIWMLVDGRTDGYGNLTLDDGTVQPLGDGDVIGAARKKKKKAQGGAEVIFVCCGGKKTRRGPGRTSAVIAGPPGQKRRTRAAPRGKVGPI